MNDIVASLFLMGALGTNGTVPFWSNANTYGLYPESSGGLAVLAVSKDYDPSHNWQYTFGGSFALRGDKTIAAEPIIDELYAGGRWKFLSLEAGVKHSEQDFFGASRTLGSLSTTSGHLTWSGNARSMPGVAFNLHTVAFPWTKGHLLFEGSFGEYLATDYRYMSNALIHRLKGYAILHFGRFDFKFGLDHYVLWGGTNPEGKGMPVTFENFWRSLFGIHGSSSASTSDQINSLGDAGGSELLKFSWTEKDWSITFQHEIPYADKSGMKFQNFPDGINTLAFSFADKDKWVSDIVYEFSYTMYQSGPINDEGFTPSGEPIPWDPSKCFIGMDNYYNNGEYRSGWTFYGRPAATPLMYPEGTRNGTWRRDRIVYGVENNRIIAHHIGLGGKFFRVAPYRLMLTYSRNYGTYKEPYAGESAADKEWGTVQETPLHQFSCGLSGEVPIIQKKLKLTAVYGLYGDIGEVLANSFGVNLGLRLSL